MIPCLTTEHKCDALTKWHASIELCMRAAQTQRVRRPHCVAIMSANTPRGRQPDSLGRICHRDTPVHFGSCPILWLHERAKILFDLLAQRISQVGRLLADARVWLRSLHVRHPPKVPQGLSRLRAARVTNTLALVACNTCLVAKAARRRVLICGETSSFSKSKRPPVLPSLASCMHL